MWKWFRRLMTIIIPLVLVILEHEHAIGFSDNVYEGLIGQATWWKWLHIYQSFLFAGVAVGAYLLTIDIQNIWALLSRVFLWVFLVAYIVFDSTAGISVGFLLEQARDNAALDRNTMKTVVQQLFEDPVIGGLYSVLSVLGSYAWLIAIVTAILALYHKYRWMPKWKILPPLILLAVSAYCLFVGHYPPYGPLAFGSFALANLWFEFFRFRIGEDWY